MAIEKRLPKGVVFKLLLRRRRRRRRRHRSSKRPLDSSRYCIAMFSTNVLTSLFLNKQKLSHKNELLCNFSECTKHLIKSCYGGGGWMEIVGISED